MNTTFSNKLFLEEGQANTLEGVLIDEEDYHFLLEYPWWKDQGYIKTTGGQFLHRLVMSAKPGELIDHINGVLSDCRKQNLRITSRRVNALNCPRGKNKTTGIRLHFSGKWQARLGQKSLGLFNTREEAEQTRKFFLEVELHDHKTK